MSEILPCRCSLYAFPHRRSTKCRDPDPFDRTDIPEQDKLFWQDYHQRVAEFRR